MKLRLLLLMLVMFAAISGCASVCDQIEAQLPAVNAKLADVQRTIASVEESDLRSHLSGDALAKYDQALAGMKEGYALAVQSAALADVACTDSSSYIDMIVAAWDVIRPLLYLVGGTGTPAIPDPVVWVEARRG